MQSDLRLNGLRCALMTVRSFRGPYADKALHFHSLADGRFVPCFDGHCELRRMQGEQAES